MTLTLQQIHKRAAERPDGYVAEVLAAGTLSRDGQTLEITEDALKKLRDKYRPSPVPASPSTPCPGCSKGKHNHDLE